jgi:hypothetical protein
MYITFPKNQSLCRETAGPYFGQRFHAFKHVFPFITVLEGRNMLEVFDYDVESVPKLRKPRQLS